MHDRLKQTTTTPHPQDAHQCGSVRPVPLILDRPVALVLGCCGEPFLPRMTSFRNGQEFHPVTAVEMNTPDDRDADHQPGRQRDRVLQLPKGAAFK